MGSRGAMGSEVASSAQSRRETGRTRDGESMATDVCVSTLTRDGGDVWVEDDTIGGAQDWIPTSAVGRKFALLAQSPSLKAVVQAALMS